MRISHLLRIAATLTASATILSACGGGTPAPPVTPASTTAPASAPQVAGSPISHVIVIVQENRTMDNLFSTSFLTNGGPYPGANVATTWTDPLGATHPLAQVPFEFPADPSHSHTSLLAEWDGGKMDGFFTDQVSPVAGTSTPPNGFVYAQVPDFETLIYHSLASRYALADNMFSSRLVPSFPGHLMLIAGQSDPSDDPTDPLVWGCDSQPGATVPVFNPSAGPEAITTPGPAPCFDYQTLGDLLDQAHVTWKYYTGQIGSIDGGVSSYDAIKHIRNGPDWTNNISNPNTNVLNDIQNCTLPAVSWVMPPALASDHAGDLSNGGPGWVGTIYLAIAQSQALQKNAACQYYGNTAIILTWDDSGGWYDHVAPPMGPNGTSMGFRVPLLVVSSFAKSGFDPNNKLAPPYVSHTQRDFGSILRYIEKNWNLGTLGARDTGADDLSDMFNYTQNPIPPVTAADMQRMINLSDWNRVKTMKATIPVDDDK